MKKETSIKSKIQSYKAKMQNWFRDHFGFLARFKKKFNKSLTESRQTGNINKYYIGLLLYIISGIVLGFLVAKGVVFLIKNKDGDNNVKIEEVKIVEEEKNINKEEIKKEDVKLENEIEEPKKDNDSYISKIKQYFNDVKFFNKKEITQEEKSKIETEDLAFDVNGNKLSLSVPISKKDQNGEYVYNIKQKTDNRFFSINKINNKDENKSENKIADIYMSYEGDRKRDSEGYIKANLSSYVKNTKGESLIIGDKTVTKVESKNNLRSWYILSLQNENWLMVAEIDAKDAGDFENILSDISIK